MSVNFNQENNSTTLLKYSSKVYFKALPKTLILVAVILGVLCLINYAPKWIPKDYQEEVSLGIMFAYIALLPLFAMIFHITDVTAKNINISTTEILMRPFQRMLSLFGCLISMCLVPLIIFAISFATVMAGSHYNVDVRVLFFLPLFFYCLIFLSLLPKVYAPILTITDNMDTNAALDTSSATYKGFFARNLIHVGFGFSLLLGIVSLPNLMHYYLPLTQTDWPQWAPHAISGILFLFIFPWVAALLVCHKIDLLYRYKNKQQTEEKNKKRDFAYDHKIKKSGVNITKDKKQVPPSDDDVGF